MSVALGDIKQDLDRQAKVMKISRTELLRRALGLYLTAQKHAVDHEVTLLDGQKNQVVVRL